MIMLLLFTEESQREYTWSIVKKLLFFYLKGNKFTVVVNELPSYSHLLKIKV